MNKQKGTLMYYLIPFLFGWLIIILVGLLFFKADEAEANSAVAVATTNLMLANASNNTDRQRLEEEKAFRESNPTTVSEVDLTPQPQPVVGLRVKASCNSDITTRIHREPGYYIVVHDIHHLILDDGRRFIFPQQQCILEY